MSYCDDRSRDYLTQARGIITGSTPGIRVDDRKGEALRARSLVDRGVRLVRPRMNSALGDFLHAPLRHRHL